VPESLANQFVTTLAGNGGSITSGAMSFNVTDPLPSGVVAPVRATIYVAGATTGEVVLAGVVSGTAWSSVSRGQETTLGAAAAGSHNDGDFVALTLTAQGLRNLIPAFDPLAAYMAFR
jgi:hypothetical protein